MTTSMTTGIVPRWEWRAFGELGEAAARLAATAPQGAHESDESYLVSRDGEDAVKVRDGLLATHAASPLLGDVRESFTELPVPAYDPAWRFEVKVAPAEESRIEVTAFKRAFKVLSPAHREVLVLVAVHGLPYEQVAAICGCEVGTVKSRVNRARAMLKKMLYEDGLPIDPRRLPGSDKATRLVEPAIKQVATAGRAAAIAVKPTSGIARVLN